MTKLPKLLQNEIIYSSEDGEFRAWEQSNETVTLLVITKRDNPDVLSFPIEAVPNLIKFLETIKISK